MAWRLYHHPMHYTTHGTHLLNTQWLLQGQQEAQRQDPCACSSSCRRRWVTAPPATAASDSLAALHPHLCAPLHAQLHKLCCCHDCGNGSAEQPSSSTNTSNTRPVASPGQGPAVLPATAKEDCQQGSGAATPEEANPAAVLLLLLLLPRWLTCWQSASSWPCCMPSRCRTKTWPSPGCSSTSTLSC